MEKHMVGNAQVRAEIPSYTRDFIKFLHGLDTPIHYIALPQLDTDKYTKVAYGLLEDDSVQKLLGIASKHKKCISVAVNRFYDTGRKEKDLQYVNAFCIDSDGTDFPGIDSFPIPPDCVVGRSAKRWHAYWKITDRGMTISQWREVQYMLALYFHTDKTTNLTLTCLMLRLPGFQHYKNPKSPQVYKIKHMRGKNTDSTDSRTDISYASFKNTFYPLLSDQQKNALDIFQMGISMKSGSSIEVDDIELTDDPEAIQKCKNQLLSFPAAIEGSNGDAQTYKACCIGVNCRLKKDTFLELLDTYYNQRCLPPWSLEELQVKINNAYTYSNKQEIVVNTSEIVNTDDCVVGEKWELKLSINEKTGKYSSTFNNLVLVLRNHELLKGKIYYDSFKNEVRHHDIPFLNSKISNYWEDSDTLSVRMFLNRFGFDMTTKNIHEGVMFIAHENKCNPAKDYFESLKWDNVPRLDKVLSTYYRAEDTEYTRIVGAKTLCAAVARVLNPGIKFDTILILEGPQGYMKSMGIEVLAGTEFFTDSLRNITDKDTVMAMQGSIFSEIAELHSFKKAEINSLKEFLARKVDKMRPPYGRSVHYYPRQGVFIGTTNDCTYLQDETGARRFWPVKVTGKVDIVGLKRDRDQLWAEAVSRYMFGETLYIEEDRHLKLAEEEQETRRVVDQWEEEIKEYLVGKTRVQTRQIWEDVFTETMKNFSRGDQLRISKCLRSLGYENGTYREDGEVVRGYTKMEKEEIL